MALLLPVLPADAASDQRLADASTAELAAAKARYERAFSEYTRLSTTGGAGDINKALAEYRAAYQAYQGAQAAQAAQTRQPPAPTAVRPAAPVASPARSAQPQPQPTPPTAAAAPQGVVAISQMPFEGFRIDRLPELSRQHDPRMPWVAAASATEPPDARRLTAYGGTLTEAMNKLQLMHGKAPTPTINAHAAMWAPMYAFPTAQTQSHVERLVPALDEAVAAGTELEILAPALRDSLVDLATTAATGNDAATRVALRAAAAHAAVVEQSRQKLQAAAQRVRQLGDPPNPLAAWQAARALHRAALPLRPAAPLPAAAAQPAPSEGRCTNPFGDCTVSNIRIVSTQPKPGETAVIVPITSSTPAASEPVRPTAAQAPAAAHIAAAGGTEADAQAEAIAQHLEVARQREDSARRWEADAQREKDPVRKKDLLDRAEFERDMAQAARDLASSLQTGTLVHTRTEWQNRQAMNLIVQIRSELVEFDKEHQRIKDIPKLAAMVAGADGQRIQAEIHQRMREALTASDRGARLDQLHAQLKRVVTSQWDAELGQQQARVAQAEANLATAEGIKAGVDAAFFAATWLVPGAGGVSMAYGAGIGYAEGGVVQAVENTARAYSDSVDIGLAAVHAALELDASGQRSGLGAGLQAAFSTAVLNKLTNVLAARTTGLVGGGIGRPRAGVASGGAAPRPEAFKDNHQRYHEAVQAARTPEQRRVVAQQFAVVAARENLRAELAATTAQHEKNLPLTARGPDGSIDVNSPAYKKARENWQRDMESVRQKYAPLENRMAAHAQAVAEAFLGPNEINLSGGRPKSVMSDMDVMPASEAAGKAYVGAMRKNGQQVLDFPDRWIVPGLDLTVWKSPTRGADHPGSSSYEAAVLHDAMEGSDKFPTAGGVEYTTSASGQTGDPEGAVISNFKKAQEAGIGGARASDLHVVGKSLNKALQISGAAADASLQAKAAAVREHRTAEEAGISTFGLSAEAKAREQARFLAQSRSAFADAMFVAGQKSEAAAAGLRKQLAEAEARRDAATAHALRAQLARYTISKQVTMQSIANRDPAAVASVMSRRKLPPPSSRGYGWLAEQMARDRQALDRVMAMPAPTLALPGVGERCRAASATVTARMAAVRAGSAEATYLQRLKAALDRGVANPGLAVNEVRLVAGQELAQVLRELAPTAAR
jgi:hypothetical protein